MAARATPARLSGPAALSSMPSRHRASFHATSGKSGHKIGAMKHIARAAALAVISLGATLALSADQGNASAVDAAFKAYWDAPSTWDAAAAVPAILASGVTFDEAWRRLKEGRPYSATAKKGVVKYAYEANGLGFYFAVDIPESYKPPRAYQW